MKKLLVTLCFGAVLLSACATDEDVIIINKSAKKHQKVVKQRSGQEIIYNK
jgi:hypothetical protein